MEIKNVFILILVLQFLISNPSIPAVFAAEPGDLNKAIEERVRALQEINAQIEKTEQQIAETQTQQKTLKQEVTKLNYGINQVGLSIKSSEINIEKTALEISKLQGEIEQTTGSLDIKRSAVKKFLRQLQQRDREPLFLAFLNNRSLVDGFFEFQNISSLNQKLGEEVKNLQVLQQTLSQQFKNQSSKKMTLAKENQTLKSRKDILSDQKTSRSGLLAQTLNQEKLYQQQLSDLEKKQSAIGEEIEKIEDELRKTFDPTILPIKRPGVLGRPVSGKISQEYGQTPIGKRLYKNGFHNGVDFASPIGTPIAVAEDGQVIAVGDNGRLQYGKYVLIKHDNNLSTLYAHLSRPAVSTGISVKRGDIIGYTGNTGYSFGPHLHFTVYWAPSVRLENFSTCNCGLIPLGITINPLDYLER